MELRILQPSWLSIALMLAFVHVFIAPAHALYFHMENGIAKCFHEELPKDTLVVGHFKTKQWHPDSHQFQEDSQISVYISVEEIFDNYHRVVSQRGDAKGRFTFSAAESGEHRICFTATSSGGHRGRLANGEETGGIQFELDLAIGETSNIESADKSTLADIAKMVSNLNNRLQDIRREQVFQREREAEFRDQSETTNSRVVRWSLIQLAVLGVTCAWQLSHLRAFFIKQKLT